MQNKTKKRIGIVAAMLVLLIAIVAVAGTTLAKYISSATIDSQEATVAQWGFTVTVNADDLFSKQYNAGKIVEAEAEEIDVKASGDYKLVAPGTSSEDAEGTMKIIINGTAEVDAKLVIDVETLTTVWLDTAAECVVGEEEDLEALGEDIYYPIAWTVNGEAVDFTEEDTTPAEALAAAFAAVLEAEYPELTVEIDEENAAIVTMYIPQGTEIDELELELAWVWEFEQGKDVEDTILGWLAAGVEGGTSYDGTSDVTVDISDLEDGTDYNLDVELAMTVRVEQTQNS